jgi:hypothetical protein
MDYESFLREIGNSINRGMEKTFWDRDNYDYRGWEIEEGEAGREEEVEGEEGPEEEVMAVSTTPS